MLMITKCEENDLEFKRELANKAGDNRYQNREGRMEAKRRGVDMNYYDSLVKECELYQSFIQQYNRQL